MADADESRVRGGVLRSAGLFAAYSLVTVWWSWPGIWNWSTKVAYAVIGFPTLQVADFYLITWTLSWVSHALVTHPAALFDGNTFFPAKLTVAYSESMLGYLPLFAPVYWASGNPILAINLTGALTYPLSALFMYFFARLYVGDAAAALSGFFYAFTVTRYALPPHYQCLGIQYFPLILLAIEQWLRRAQVRFLLLLFLALTLQSLSSAYLLYAVFLMACPFVVLAVWHHRAMLDRRRVVGLFATGAVAAAVVVAFMWPYLILQAQGLTHGYDEEHGALGLVPVLATRYLTHVLFQHGIGWIGFALVAAGLLFAWSKGARWPKAIALLLVTVGCVVSFGPRIAVGGLDLWSPYVLLRDHLPGFASVRSPGRLAVIAEVGLALLAGLGADAILRRARPAVGALAASGVAVGALALMAPFPELPLHLVPVRGTIPPGYQWLREHGGGRAVLELPEAVGPDGKGYRAYLSTAHWQPIVEGYAANAPTHGDYVYWIARDLPDAEALQRLVDVIDIGWILVHRGQLDPEHLERWSGDLPDGLELAGWWGDDRLYRVTLPPQDDRRARLLSMTETLNGVRIAPLGTDCAGELRFDAWDEPPGAAGASASVEILVVNHSASVWPALGFLPRNVVALEATVFDPGGRRFTEPAQIPLADDVAPDDPRPAVVHFEVPRRPGRYVLRVHLMQGTEKLDRCAAPLEVPFEVPAPHKVVTRAHAAEAVQR